MPTFRAHTRAIALVMAVLALMLHAPAAHARTTTDPVPKTKKPAAAKKAASTTAPKPAPLGPKHRPAGQPPRPSRVQTAARNANASVDAAALRAVTTPAMPHLDDHSPKLALRSLPKGAARVERPNDGLGNSKASARAPITTKAGVSGTPCDTSAIWITTEVCVDANHGMVVAGGAGENNQFSIYYGYVLTPAGVPTDVASIDIVDNSGYPIIGDAPCANAQDQDGYHANWVYCPINLLNAWNADHAIIYGNDGDDRIWTSRGEITQRDFPYALWEYGGPGQDKLYASPATGTTLVGDDQHDELYGGPYGDALFGGNDDDYIKPGGGNDTISGGNGWDTLDYWQGAYSNVTVSPDNQPNDPGGSNIWNDTELISGTAGNDVFIGGNGLNESYEFHANGGRDTFFSGPDPDTFKGTGGAPDLTGSGAADIVSYGPTANYGNLFPGGVAATIGGYGPGGDFLDNNIDIIRGTAATDYLNGDGSANLLIGSGGTDYLWGGGGAGDLLYGDAGPNASLPAGETPGNDVLYADGDGDTFHGGGGNDTVTYEHLSSGVTANLGHGSVQGQGPGGDRIAADITTLEGSTGPDSLSDSNDGRTETLLGIEGDDTFHIGSASGVIGVDGGAGVNTVDYSGWNQNQGVYVSPGAPGSDQLTSVQRVVGTQYVDEFDGVGNGMTYIGMGANDTFTASSSGVDTFFGDALPYAITGIGPAGTIVGLVGDHDIADYRMRCGVHITIGATDTDGTLGNDVEEVDGTGCADTIHGNGNPNWIHGGDGDDYLYGGGGNDYLYGEDGSDHLYGEDGDDQLQGGASDDFLYGGAGGDRMWWEPGKDLYDPGDGSTQVGHYDVIDYSQATSKILVTVNGVCDSGTANDHDCLDQGGFGNLVAFIGSNFDDTFKGSGGREWFIGGGGNDSFWGEGGADWFNGDCDGLIYGCNPNFPYGNHDAVHYDDITQDITAKIDGNADSGIGGPAEGDLIATDVEDIWGGSGNDVIAGNTTSVGSQDNTLVGGPGNDHLYGYAGKDVLDGGPGDDWLYGANGQQSGTAGESDTLYGGIGNDHLYGEDGADILFGGLGDDILVGGPVNGTNDNARDIIDARDGMPSVKGAHVKPDGTSDPNEDYEPDTHFVDRVTCTGTGTARDEWFGDPTDFATGCDKSLLEYIGIPLALGEYGILEFHPLPTAPSEGGMSTLGQLGLSAYDEIFTRDGGLQDQLVNLIRSSLVVAMPDEAITWYAADRLIEKFFVDPKTAEAFVEYIDLAAPINIEEHFDKCHYGDTHYIVFCTPPSQGVDIQERKGPDEVRVFDAPKTHVSLGDGDDTLMHDGNGPVGADGGAGNNSLIVNRPAGTTESIVSGTDDTPGASGLTTKNFNTFIGGAEDDSFTGTTASETFDGGGGFNSLSYLDHSAIQGVTVTIPGAGATTHNNGITGGTEHDTLTNIESVSGTPGNDVINGSPGDDTIAGGGGTDTLDGKGGNNTLSFADKTASQPVVMTLGANGSGSVSVPGETVTYANFVNVTGGEGNDQITGNASANVIHGDGGNDIMNGGAGNDTLYGDAGNDTLDGQGGADVMNGGADDDTITYASRITGVTVTVGDGLANDGETINGVSEGDDVQGSPGTDTIIGTSSADTFTGDANPQHFVGGAGNDVMNAGGGGPDIFEGDADYDTVRYTTAVKDLNLVVGGVSHGDIAERAQIGTDVEEVDGGSGNDTFMGTVANQKFDGGPGVNTVSYMDHVTQPVTVNLPDGDAVSTGNGWGAADGGTESDTLVHITNAIGGWQNDHLNGGALANTLAGGPGNDVLHGGAGNDLLVADGGDDTFYGDDGSDTLSYAKFPWTINAHLPDAGISSPNGMFGQKDKIDVSVENLTGGTGNDNLYGNQFANRLDGGIGNDTLVGNGGGDTLYGGAGNDFLYGDAGPGTPVDGNGMHVLASGLPGVDTFDGGSGADIIDAVDQQTEVVSCGADSGFAMVDQSDTANDLTISCINVPVGWSKTTMPMSAASVRGVAMTSPAPGEVDVAFIAPMIGNTSAWSLYYTSYFDSSGWGPVNPLTTSVALKSPGIASIGPNQQEVSWVDGSGNVWVQTLGCRPAGVCALGPQRNLGRPNATAAGSGGTGPVTLLPITQGGVMLFVEGADKKLWYNWDSSTGTLGWFAAQGAPMLTRTVPAENPALGPSLITAVKRDTYNSYVFVVDSNGNLEQGTLSYTGFGPLFTAWTTLGRPADTTTLLRGVSAANDATSTFVFVRDAAGTLRERTFTSGGWSAWTTLRPGSNPAVPAVIATPGAGRIALGLVDSSYAFKFQQFYPRPTGI
jgi:Ca2+-binding RTX toxin-like protein